MPEPLLRDLWIEPDQIEDLLLHLSTVYSDAAPCDLLPITHQIVLLAADRAGVGLQQRQVLRHGRGELVVARVPALPLLIPLEEGEINHPAAGKRIPIAEPQALCHL